MLMKFFLSRKNIQLHKMCKIRSILKKQTLIKERHTVNLQLFSIPENGGGGLWTSRFCCSGSWCKGLLNDSVTWFNLPRSNIQVKEIQLDGKSWVTVNPDDSSQFHDSQSKVASFAPTDFINLFNDSPIRNWVPLQPCANQKTNFGLKYIFLICFAKKSWEKQSDFIFKG